MKIRSLLAGLALAAFTLAAQPAAADTLIIQDGSPCGDDATEQILTNWGITYRVVASNRIPLPEKLQNYDSIVVSSHQGSGFYRSLQNAMPRITNWLKSGPHTLEFHGAAGCAENPYTLTLPRGVVASMHNWAPSNHVVRRSPLLVGVPNEFQPHNSVGWISDHTFTPLGNVLVMDDQQEPTLMSYCVGSGRVIATGIMVERAWVDGWDSGSLLPNMLHASVYTPGCPSLPAQ